MTSAPPPPTHACVSAWRCGLSRPCTVLQILQREAISRFELEIDALLAAHAVVPVPHIDWAEYQSHFLGLGGLLEAWPCPLATPMVVADVSFEPGATVRILATHTRIARTPFGDAVVVYPQTSVDNTTLLDALRPITTQLHSAGVLGALTVSFALVPAVPTRRSSVMVDRAPVGTTLVPVRVDPRTTDSQLLVGLLRARFNASFDEQTGSMSFLGGEPKTRQPGFVVGAAQLRHAGFAAMDHAVLRILCEARGICIAPVTQTGTLILPYGADASTSLGILCLDTARQGAVDMFFRSINVLEMECDSGADRAEQNLDQLSACLREWGAHG